MSSRPLQVQVFFDMFPAIPRQTLASIWQNCQRDFSVALDEALTISSLGTASEQGGCSLVLQAFNLLVHSQIARHDRIVVATAT